MLYSGDDDENSVDSESEEMESSDEEVASVTSAVRGRGCRRGQGHGRGHGRGTLQARRPGKDLSRLNGKHFPYKDTSQRKKCIVCSKTEWA